MSEDEMSAALERLRERDPIYASFLDKTAAEARELCTDSEVVSLTRISPAHFLGQFHCKGLVKNGAAPVEEADEFAVGFHLHQSYLRVVHPGLVLTLVHPRSAFHPNIGNEGHEMCIGDIRPGTGLPELIYRVYELITFGNFSVVESDAFNRDACSWARQNLDLFPLESRALRAAKPVEKTEAVLT